MPLSKGDQLGPYEILALIGEGGMGEVYRGRDTRLDRTVAIKVVKGDFAERFGREARAISALNHPHICALYDIGSAGAVSYLVMEYVDGKPARGPMTVTGALSLGVQIASALAAAHKASIVHRDLKPDNILLTPSGPKLLDFGLAKFSQTFTGSIHATMSLPVTAEGQIVGTLFYMAPEQLEGREADARSDIFSFGVVLYELLTGKLPFDGSSPASIIAAILKEEPKPLLALQPLSPPALDRTLRKCLAKDPNHRWQTAADLRDELEWISTESQIPVRPVSRRSLLPWAFAAGGAVAGAATGIAAWPWLSRTPAPRAQALRFRISLPPGIWLDRQITRQTLALSPTGNRFAFIGRTRGSSMIWLQPLDSLTASPVQGTEGARMLFWSYDGQSIGFHGGGKLMKVPAGGGTPLPICDLFEPWTASWNQHGQIFAAAARQASALIQVDSGSVKSWRPLFWPVFLPDGKRLLFLEVDEKIRSFRSYVEEISTGRKTELIPTETRVCYSPDRLGGTEGSLLFCRGGTLLAQPFDAGRLAFTGEPQPVVERIPFFRPAAWSDFSASQDGTLVYSSGFPSAQLVWLDRAGREIGRIAQPQPYSGDFRISPDGRKLLTGIFDLPNGGVDQWLHDLEKGASERITFDSGVEAMAVWSPDGGRFAYGNAQVSAPKLRVRNVGSSAHDEAYPEDLFQIPLHWSSDGRWIFYQTTGGDSDAEIWVASTGSRKLIPLLQKPFDHSQPSLSPDGKHLAFVANGSGRQEVYVQRFEGGDPPRLSGERKRVSLNGGSFPRWCSGGREILFVSPERQLMSVDFRPDSQPEVGTPVALFSFPSSYRPVTQSMSGFDVSRDGKKFLALTGDNMSDPLRVIVNWPATLRKT